MRFPWYIERLRATALKDMQSLQRNLPLDLVWLRRAAGGGGPACLRVVNWIALRASIYGETAFPACDITWTRLVVAGANAKDGGFGIGVKSAMKDMASDVLLRRFLVADSITK